MEESTLNPLLADKPGPLNIRLVVQFSCGCDAYADIPVEMFVQIGRQAAAEGVQLMPVDAARYIFGQYSAQLFEELSAVNHNPDFCPATFGSVIGTEEQS